MESENVKILAALAFGALGGLMLGNIIWGSSGAKRNLSVHLATLSKVIEQLEDLDTYESEQLKEKIKNIVTTIESSYGDVEKPSK
jgi:hypothetical protein